MEINGSIDTNSIDKDSMNGDFQIKTQNRFACLIENNAAMDKNGTKKRLTNKAANTQGNERKKKLLMEKERDRGTSGEESRSLEIQL